MPTSRLVCFNPTSIPGLRTPRAPRRDFYNAARISRSGWKSYLGGTIRRESTETGENRTGHISATPNEAILFFDSELSLSFSIHKLISRYFPLEAHMGFAVTMASRAGSTGSPPTIQQPYFEFL